MARNNSEIEVTFRAQDKEFNAAIRGMNQESKKLRQEMKLQQEQMKLTATDSEKLQAKLQNLSQQYAVAQRSTQKTAEHLQRAKQLYGENSTVVAKLEAKLRSQQIAEQQLANSIKQTSESLKSAKEAESERTSESAKAIQKLKELKGAEEQLKASSAKLAAQYELQRTQLGENASETEKLRLKISNLSEQQTLAVSKIQNYQQQLDRAKQSYGENSAEVQKYETKLLQAMSAEQKIKNQIDATNSSLQEQANESKNVANTTQQLETLFRATGTSVDHFANALGSNLTNAIRQGTATSRQLDEAIERIGREALGTEADIERLRRSLRSIDDGNSIENVRNELRDLSREAERASQSFKELDIDLENMLGGMVAGAGISGTIEQALDMSKLKTKIDITFEVPESSKKSVEEAVRGIEAYGVDGEAALEGVRRQWALNKNVSDEANAAVVKGAAAISQAYEGIDFNELIQETHEIANELGITDDAALGLTNALLKIGFPPEQLDVIAEYGGQLTRAGYDAEEVQAIMEAGIETGTWNIDNLLDGLKEGRIKAAEFGQGVDKAMTEALQGTNISAEQLQKWGQSVAKGGKEGSAAMTEIAKALANVEDETKRNELGVKLFGTMWEDQGMNITYALLGAQSKVVDFKKNQDQLNESVKKMDANPAVKFQKAMQDLKVALEPVLSVVADLISKFAEWISNNPTLAATLAAVATAIGIIAGAAMALAPIVITITSISAAMLGWIAVIPIIIAAVVGLVVAIVKNWDEIKQWTIDTYNSIAEYLSELWSGMIETTSTWLSSLVETVSGWWSSLVESTTQWLSSMVETVSSWWSILVENASLWLSSLVDTAVGWFSSLVETASSWWSSLVETASQFFSQLIQKWQETWNSILTFLDPIISLISTVLQAGWLLISAATQIAWSAISKYIIDPITSAYNWVSGKIGELFTWLSDKYEQIKSATSTAWSLVKQYIVQPIQDAYSKVSEKLTELANWILGKWESIKSSTLSAWNTTKQYIIDPVTEAYNWCKEKFGDLVNWTKNQWESIKSATLSAWNTTKQYIIDPIRAAYNSTKEKFQEIYNSAKEKFDSVKNTAKEKFDAAKRNIIDPIKEAVDTVKGWIDKIKGFFSDLKLKIPTPEMPKLPHFSLQTSTKSVLGKDITYPSGINVDWRAKGGIFTKPTIFGMMGGNLQGAGEAGPEAVLPLNKKTLGAIGEGIAATMKQVSPNEQLFDGTEIGGQLNIITENVAKTLQNAATQLAQVTSVDIPNTTGDALLNGLPNILRTSEQVGNQQLVTVNFYNTVRNDRDIDNMFEKADDWFAQRGRNLNLGIGRG